MLVLDVQHITRNVNVLVQHCSRDEITYGERAEMTRLVYVSLPTER